MCRLSLISERLTEVYKRTTVQKNCGCIGNSECVEFNDVIEVGDGREVTRLSKPNLGQKVFKVLQPVHIYTVVKSIRTEILFVCFLVPAC